MVEIFAYLSLLLALFTPLALKTDGRLGAAAVSIVLLAVSILLGAPVGAIVALVALAISIDARLGPFGLSLSYAALATVLAIYVYYSSAPAVYALIALALVTAAVYGLLSIGKTRENVEAAVKYVVFSGVGKTLIVAGYLLAASGYSHGLYLLIAGFMFELGIAPFHAWVVDAYAMGHPRGVAALVAFSKITSLFTLLAVARQLPPSAEVGITALVVAMASMLVANVAGLTAKTLGRIMAYSSIAHMSYAFMALAVAWMLEAAGLTSLNLFGEEVTPLQMAALVVVLEALASGLAKAGVFGYLTTSISDVTPPRRSLLNVLNIFSLLGLPPLLGFWPKLFLILLAVAYPNLSIAALLVVWVVINSVVATPYYLRAIRIVAEGPGNVAENTTSSYTAFATLALGLAIPFAVLSMV